MILKTLNNKILCYVADLGLCRPSNETDNSKVFGVLPYLAPEVLQGRSYTQAADVYSFAMIAYEVMSGLPPYHEYTYDSSLALRICQGLRPNLDDVIAPRLMKDFIKKCWEADPSQRPSLSENNLKNIFAGQAEYREEGLVMVEESEFDRFNKASLKEKRLPKYGKHPQTFYTSRPINTKEINELLKSLLKSKETSRQLTKITEQIKEIEKELERFKGTLDSEAAELVDRFVEIKTQSLKNKENKQVWEQANELEEQLEEENISEENIEKIIDYCKRLVESEQQLQARVEIPINK